MNVVERSNDGVVLRKCPFCGGEARFAIDSHRFIECAKCVSSTEYCGSEEETIEKWNNRKPLERVIERLEEQAEECKKYWDEFDDEDAFGGMNAYMNSIAIIKQEMM